ncbi:MAG: UDP-N-acetylglucosamine 2-epimerase (non-hydrolyzing) [Burkholderiaceae bacterium]|nr:UDP-N-acetylglucosamine 2-epimerase (non-hydrolyzing) [Burkholderiaceae bacterium]
MKILTVVGARPQFVKAAAISRAIAASYADRIEEVLVHTGQHFDSNMSQVFFEELGIPEPAHNLGIAGGGHGAMTGRMLEAIERVLIDERPDALLIYGDTNSTLAGALAAAKLHVPIAHVEAGLRSFNMRMPEEVNRILADRVSTLLLCPTPAAVENLATEGVRDGVHMVGDVMYDVALFYRERARAQSTLLATLGLQEGPFVLATCHRAENTDDPSRLAGIVGALAEIGRRMQVVFPVHPRTRKLLADGGHLERMGDVRLLEPIPFLDMVALEQASRVVLTDSGGVQKEALFYHVPCVTMRDETEWVETVELGWNRLAGADRDRIVAAFEDSLASEPSRDVAPYGAGDASDRICALLTSEIPVAVRAHRDA